MKITGYFPGNFLDDKSKSIESEDYTRCYYEDKLEKYLNSECLESAVIDGELTNDSSLSTILFNSQFPVCHERQP